MGLAASQARFLAITARKADCEYRSMTLAEEQLSLSRELEAATEDYENSINATRLVWDMDGSGEYMYDVSYNTLMYPSEANKYTPYMLARTDGKIAVSDEYTNALYNSIKEVLGEDAIAEMFSDDGKTFKGFADYRNSNTNQIVSISDDQKKQIYLKYLEELQKSNAISTTASIAASAIGLKPYAGLGEELMGRETTNQMYFSTMIDYINLITERAATGYYPPGSSEVKLADALTFSFNYDAYNSSLKNPSNTTNKTPIKSLDPSFVNEEHAAAIMFNGSYCTSTSYSTNSNGNYTGTSVSGAFNLADLLNEDIALVATGCNSNTFNKVLDNIENAIKVGNGQGSSAFTLLVDKDITEWYDEVAGDGALAALNKDELGVVTFIDQLAKSMWKLLMPDPPTNTELNAFYTSMTDLISRFRIPTASDNEADAETGSKYANLGGKGSNEGNAKTAASYSSKYNCWVKKGNQWAMNLSNMAETFLTNFCNGMDNYEGDYGIFRKANASYYITYDDNYIYTINNGDSVDEDMWSAEFYSIIFNTLGQNGAYVNDQIKDEDYLQNAIKNGQLFVVSKGSDNYFYQSRYAQISGDHIVEVSDTNAIAQAEREYTLAKSRINVKEEKVQLEMKRVDAELSSLNTEYDTVKSLISTNVQKIFSLFQSS